MTRLDIAVATLATALLAACASGPTATPAERLALLNQHAGEPVNTIRHPGRFAGWHAVGNSALVLQTRPSEAFLLDLGAPCHDLSFAHAIRVSSRTSWISARFDYIVPMAHGRTPMPMRCHIQSIRPLDVAALRQARLEMQEEATPIEREDEAGGESTEPTGDSSG